MVVNVDSKVFQRLAHLVSEPGRFEARTGDDELYEKFITTYPAERLSELSLDDYCLGQGSKPENFCWWLEFKLKTAVGKFFAGSARTHLVFKDPKEPSGYYINKQLTTLGPEAALEHVLKLYSLFALADPQSDLSWMDDRRKLYAQAGLELKDLPSPGIKLRLLSAYHPEDILPITSVEHLGAFLHNLEHPGEDIPSNQQPIARMLRLKLYYQILKERYNSRLTPYGFMNALYSDELGINPKSQTWRSAPVTPTSEVNQPIIPLNQILFGPPGTGKTFATTALAVEITDPDWYRERQETLDEKSFRLAVKQRYEERVHQQRIVFTTFHQSFAYEDFIEGIRASTDEESGALRYEIQDGIFKQLCLAADVHVTAPEIGPIDLKARQVWKMSLGNTLADDDSGIYEECLEKNYILLGYGDDVDFSQQTSKSEISAQYLERTGQQLEERSFLPTAVYRFKQEMRTGDLIIISEGNTKFRAIGEITGPYRYLDERSRSDYQQMRQVKWLRVYQPSLPREQLFKKNLSQQSLYKLGAQTLDIEKLSELLKPPTQNHVVPHVLIIDEINRGNIARIFGELITLLEPSKRKGASDARQAVLPYSKNSFSVPGHVYVIGTMNTADKSLTELDLALRRRFSFKEMQPTPELLAGYQVHGVDLCDLLTVLNQRIEVLLDQEHLIGHSYFLPLLLTSSNERESKLAEIFQQQILPLLQEYFYADWERIGWVLNDPVKAHQDRFITSVRKPGLDKLFAPEIAEQLSDRRLVINTNAFRNPKAYQGILSGTLNT